MYKRDYAFRMSVMEEIFEIRSCIALFTELSLCIFVCVWHRHTCVLNVHKIHMHFSYFERLYFLVGYCVSAVN